MYEAPKSFFPQCTFTDALGCTPNHKMNIFTECNHFRLCKAFAAQLGNQKSSFCQEKSSSAMLHIMILHSSRTLNTICKLSLNKQTQKENKDTTPESGWTRRNANQRCLQIGDWDNQRAGKKSSNRNRAFLLQEQPFFLLIIHFLCTLLYLPSE